MSGEGQSASRMVKINKEMIEKASKGHYYIKVGSRGGTLLLSGAASRWKKAEFDDWGYLPTVRLTGTKSDLVQALEAMSCTKQQIDEHLASGYFKDRCDDPRVSEQMEEELKALESFKKEEAVKSAQTKSQQFTLDMVPDLLQSLSKAEIINTTKKPTDKSTSTTSRPVRTFSLQEKINKLSPGQVIDVTNMKANGVGSKVISEPSAMSSKVRLGKYPIVCSTEDRATAAALLIVDKDSVSDLVQEWRKLKDQRTKAPRPRKETKKEKSTETTKKAPKKEPSAKPVASKLPTGKSVAASKPVASAPKEVTEPTKPSQSSAPATGKPAVKSLVPPKPVGKPVGKVALPEVGRVVGKGGSQLAAVPSSFPSPKK